MKTHIQLFVLQTSRNLLKHIIHKWGGHIWPFHDDLRAQFFWTKSGWPGFGADWCSNKVHPVLICRSVHLEFHWSFLVLLLSSCCYCHCFLFVLIMVHLLVVHVVKLVSSSQRAQSHHRVVSWPISSLDLFSDNILEGITSLCCFLRNFHPHVKKSWVAISQKLQGVVFTFWRWYQITFGKVANSSSY